MTVGIVGLGIAGLRAAMLLERAGVSVKLFEARGRPGGRLYTIDEGGGAVYEAGGEWIDADHARTLELLAEFGMERITPSEWPKKIVYGGRESTEALLWSDTMEDDLRVESAARELCRDLSEPPWRNTHAADLDARNLADFLVEHTQTDRGLWYVTAKIRSDEGEDPERIGLLGWLSGYLHYLDREGDVMSAYRFPGGASALCRSMIDSLKAEPRYGCVLDRVTQSAEGVRLQFENGDAAIVDRVVLTLPPTALECVVFEPALGVDKRCAIEACRIGRAVKIALQFEEPWWKELDWGGSMLCDGPLQQTWDGSLGEAPILNAYICGERAAEWMALGDPVNAAVYELAKMFPQSAKCFVRGWKHDWLSDPFSRGGFSHLAPGYVLEHMQHIAPPEGRVHFAGEHTGLWTGFIEGAVESAERVSAEILQVEGQDA